MSLRLPILALAALTLGGCVTVTEQYAEEGYFSAPNNGYSGGGDGSGGDNGGNKGGVGGGSGGEQRR